MGLQGTARSFVAQNKHH